MLHLRDATSPRTWRTRLITCYRGDPTKSFDAGHVMQAFMFAMMSTTDWNWHQARRNRISTPSTSLGDQTSNMGICTQGQTSAHRQTPAVVLDSDDDSDVKQQRKWLTICCTSPYTELELLKRSMWTVEQLTDVDEAELGLLSKKVAVHWEGDMSKVFQYP
jgi:hypothetical protein